MDRILSMILNRLIGQLVNRGINAGIDRAVGGKGQNLTPEQRAQSKSAKEAVRRSRQAAAILRRLRF